MTLAIIHSRANVGISAHAVTVEVHVSPGLPAFNIVGLAETAVKESRHRVRSALINCGFQFPPRKITVNLAPADLPKEGGRFDLPIAVGVLAATNQLPTDELQQLEFVGELALSGKLRVITGALPVAMTCQAAERALILPQANATEACLPKKLTAYAAEHLLDVIAHINHGQRLKPLPRKNSNAQLDYPDFQDVRGQIYAKRALEIAAAGNHSLLMCGPPGSGKTMLASRLPGILPPMSDSEALEAAAIASIHGKTDMTEFWHRRSFRRPHHTASGPALVGGGSPPKPGEISLSHHGVLFLDELPEFSRHVLETLREPIESGTIMISRASAQAEFPARFQLIAAMNPCPCGYLTDDARECRCTPEQVKRYRAKLSGPLLDRIDLHLEVPALPIEELTKRCDPNAEKSQTIQQRVINARNIQLIRQNCPNAQLDGEALYQHCQLESEAEKFLLSAMEKLQLSARAYHRVLRLGRTIADLTQTETLNKTHISEALNYRPSPFLFYEPDY